MQRIDQNDAINDELAEAAYDTVYRFCRAQGISQEDVAPMVRCKVTTFSNYLNASRRLPAALVVRITKKCGLGLIQKLCKDSGGVFVAMPRGKDFGSGPAAYRAAITFVKTAGDGAALCFRVLEDGRLTKDELRKVKNFLARLAEAVNVLQRAFEEMPLSPDDDDDLDDNGGDNDAA